MKDKDRLLSDLANTVAPRQFDLPKNLGGGFKYFFFHSYLGK